MGNASSQSSPSVRDQAKPSNNHRPPMLPNESFVLLQDSVIRNIPSPIPSPALAKKGATNKSRHNTPAVVQVSPPTEEVTHPNPSPLSHHLRSTQRLFNLLSSRTEIDHPLCAECTHELLTFLKAQLDETKKERDGYIAFEKEVRKEREKEKEGTNKADVETKIEKLKEEERFAVEQLKAAEKERAQLEDELKALELEEKALEEEEAELVAYPPMMVVFGNVDMPCRFWRVHNAHLLKAAEQASQLAALRAAYAADSATLEKLERTNVYNDAFCIGHDGVFGTINGLRLGRVAGVQVSPQFPRAIHLI